MAEMQNQSMDKHEAGCIVHHVVAFQRRTPRSTVAGTLSSSTLRLGPFTLLVKDSAGIVGTELLQMIATIERFSP